MYNYKGEEKDSLYVDLFYTEFQSVIGESVWREFFSGTQWKKIPFLQDILFD